MKVQGPNGVVVDVRPSVATGLVGNGSRGYQFVSDTDTTTATSADTEARSRRGRRTKTQTPPDESESDG